MFENWKWALVGILFGVLGLVLVVATCGSNDKDACPEIQTLEKRVALPQLPSDNAKQFFRGAELVLSYNATTNTFNGTVENTATTKLIDVTVEVRKDGNWLKR